MQLSVIRLFLIFQKSKLQNYMTKVFINNNNVSVRIKYVIKMVTIVLD